MRNILIGLVILFFFVNNIFSESKSNSGAISHNTFIITCDEEGSRQKKYSVKTENASLSIYQQDDSLVYRLLNSKQEAVFTGYFGVRLPEAFGLPDENAVCPGEADTCFKWSDVASLGISLNGDQCFDIDWQVSGLQVVEDCIDIGDKNWYGGPEELIQHFPMSRSNIRKRVPYLPGDMLQDGDKFFGGVTEPVWINSKGGGVVVNEEQPLFYSWNENNNGKMCLSTEHTDPYAIREETVSLSYTICAAPDPKAMFEHMAGNFWTLPSNTPDEKMMSFPIWSTWAQYKTQINESVVLKFANDILDNGFNNSHLEIDDNWENCYGDAKFDSKKFPDPARVIHQLNSLGYRTSLWIHPFINTECESYPEAAFPPNMFLVRDPKSKWISNNGAFGNDQFGDFEGTAYLPGNTLWWQGFSSGYVDFTNELAAQWWIERLERLRQETGIDSFKFDAGEHNWLPSSFTLDSRFDISMWPGIFSTSYASQVSKFGNMVEVRVGRRTQHLSVFTRMLDKDSSWGYDNGLKSMVTTLLQFGITGYSYVLPDMIGGNGYSGAPSRELYIRWLQVNAFMPAMQISYVPWQYDEEVIQHALDMTRLHYQYSEIIINLARETKNSGAPINRPIWWLDPEDEAALAINDEFLLGDQVLVAPILSEGAVSRHVYLPRGYWLDGNDAQALPYIGPLWLYDYDAPLFVLPYFINVGVFH